MPEAKSKVSERPWALIEDDGEFRVQTNPGGGPLVRVDVYEPVCEGVNEANGRLIAAAPDLLAVCKLAVFNEAKADELRCSGMVDFSDTKALRAIANAARAAIAKAEGR